MASSEDHSIQHQVPCASCLVEVNVATPTVVRSEMENNLDTFRCPLCDAWLSEVRLNELDRTLVHGAAEVFDLAATEVVHNADLGAAV